MSAFTPVFPLLPRPSSAASSRMLPKMSSSRPARRSNRRQPPKKQPQPPQPTSDVFQFFDEGDPPNKIGAEELSDVDDGFFSRYMREREEAKEEEEPRPRMDREAAASAFDAVDKLFGSMNAKQGEGRKKWLDDVQARAATTEERRKGEALDVDAEDVEGRDDFSEADVEGDDDIAKERRSGFKEQTKEGNKLDDKYSFDMLMKIARRGPPGDTRRRTPRPRRDAKEETARKSGDSSKRNSDFSHLIGLTKRIVDKTDDHDNDYEPIDDEMEKTIEFGGSNKRKDGRRRQKYVAVRRIGGQSRRIFSPPAEWSPMSEEDVDNLKSDHRSLGSKGRDGRLKGVVADCKDCRGSGLDTCIVCLGTGWVPPPKDGEKMDEDRRKILEDMWNRPNLVVDTEGEAQCLRCNGIGKQFCTTCKGSGSSLRKGFSFSERDEVFDMFVNVDGAPVDEDGDDEYENDEEEEADDDFESFQLYRGSAEAFDFITKKRENVDTGSGDDDEDVDVNDVDVEDVIEVEDESDELLATLEAMHLADLKQQKSGKKSPGRRNASVSRINDEDEDEEDDDDDAEVDAVVDDVDDVDDGVDDVEDFAVDMSDTDAEELDELDDDDDDDDDDFADLVEEDISMHATLADDENDDDNDEEDYSDYD